MPGIEQSGLRNTLALRSPRSALCVEGLPLMLQSPSGGTSRCFDEGRHRAYIRVADLTIAIVSEDPGLRLQVEQATTKFLVDEADPDVRIRVAWSWLTEPMTGEKVFDSGALWQLYRKNGNYLFHFTSPYFGPQPYKMASFYSDVSYGEVYLHPGYFAAGQPIDPLEHPLAELLMVSLLARGRGVEVHAFGMVGPEGNGHLFLGQSGAGKSTMARLYRNLEGTQILSDDRIILRSLGEKLWVYGTPWHGEAPLASPVRAPLTRIYFLRHGRKNLLVPLRRAEAVGRLFACSFPLFYSPEALDFTLGFLENVVRAVPCYELRFVPDDYIVEFLQKDPWL